MQHLWVIKILKLLIVDMISKQNKKNIKKLLISFGIWNLIKKILKKDIGKPLNKNLFEEGKLFYSQFIKKDDLVFDVGANFGNRVEIFLALGAKVIAIEPQQKCVDYLTKKYGNKIIIENIGLGSKEEIKQFYEADNSVLSTFSNDYIDKVKDTRHKTSIWKKTNFISIRTLDSLIDKYGIPAFIKIDVEGYEYEVVSGLTKHAGIISFEYNVPEMLHEVEKTNTKLNEIGYTLFNYSIGESMIIKENWKDYKEFQETINHTAFSNTTFGDIYVK
jgi:FkbM family methyltransferase